MTTMTEPTPKRILIGCERSGKVRQAFRAIGFDAWSCDLEVPEDDSVHHIVGDITEQLDGEWAAAIFFPPCTDVASSGARWFAEKRRDGRQAAAIALVRLLLAAPINKIALENPIGVLSTAIRKPDQILQPWQFGHGEVKATCLWLKNLPPLQPTQIVEGRHARVWRMGPSPTRAIDRARTYDGIAKAMADQWGRVICG